MADDQTNDTQAKALIDALAPKLAEALLPTLQKQVEEQIGGVVKKNDELLAKLSEQKEHAGDLAALLAAAQGQQDARLKGGSFKPSDQKALTITKSDARNVRAYRAAKAEAEKRGVPLQIVADS